MLTIDLLLWILGGMIVVWGIWHALMYSGFNPANIIASIHGAIRGAYKAVCHWVTCVSILNIFSILFTGITLLIASIAFDIVTPPWALIIVFPFATYLMSVNPGLTSGWALGFAYGITFIASAIFIAFYWFVLRHKLKG